MNRVDFKWHGDKVLQLLKKAGMSGLHDGVEHILTVSHGEVPHDTGTLQRSGTVIDAPQKDAVYVSYGTPYAVMQHEDLTFRHDEGRKAKYLEDPFNREKDKVLKMTSERMKRALR
ncbi:MAG: hypothetical protein A4E53_01196 [Pelotomaculum sp. PtaB.Bin104]|nr:MAG: hypothetical protein A4E53_01196 [Pelotomaculum sp. PtaB.Bin104]